MPVCFLPAFGYAEIHYRFRYFFSLLKKAQPEIVADLPHRAQKGEELPLLVVIKDADQYPLLLKSVTVFVDKQKMHREILDRNINTPYEDIIIPLKTAALQSGEHLFDVKIEYRCAERDFICYNDNYRGLSHAPLLCRISGQPLPQFSGYIYGDLHSHSNYTSDQIEFGPSLTAMVRLSRSLGIQFFAVTDHSYDLDDLPHNYLQKDEKLSKWHAFQTEVRKINNRQKDVCIIPGEEVSVGNGAGHNVHLLVMNSRRFWPGGGDSGEKWLRFRPDLKLNEVLTELEDDAAAFGAHPAARTPLLQRLLINRGDWSLTDMRAAGLSGLQFINGGSEEEIFRGLETWKTLLLQGFRLFLLGGNDAHGSFARTRQIGTPFVSLREHTNHLFGFWRTGLAIGKLPLTVEALVSALKSGNYFVTSGPALRIEVLTADGKANMGEEGANPQSCRVEILSSKEYGPIIRARLIAGFPPGGTEKIIWQNENPQESFSLEKEMSVNALTAPFYLRAEAETRQDGAVYRAYSNPVWMK